MSSQWIQTLMHRQPSENTLLLDTLTQMQSIICLCSKANKSDFQIICCFGSSAPLLPSISMANWELTVCLGPFPSREPIAWVIRASQESQTNGWKCQVDCPLKEEQTFKDDPTIPRPEKQSCSHVTLIAKSVNHKTVPQLEHALTLRKMRLG